MACCIKLGLFGIFLQIEDANFFVNAAVTAAASTSCKSPSSINSGGNATAAVVGGQAPTEVTTDVFVFPNVSVTAAAEVCKRRAVCVCERARAAHC